MPEWCLWHLAGGRHGYVVGSVHQHTTQTAYLPINGVPAGGGAGNVTATYHCKVKVGPWTLPGPGEPANGQRWIYGSGTQPTYTL